MKQNFKFLKNHLSGKWVILAPKRALRPDVSAGKEPICPFCEGREDLTPKEVYRVGRGEKNKPGWQIRVIPNKFPFAPTHELVIHSPNHKDSFFTYKPSYIAKVIQVYKERYCHYEKEGQVLILYNHGIAGGESLTHSHSQIVVIPDQVPLDAPRAASPENIIHESDYFVTFIPLASSWPYEVWFLPKVRGLRFGEIENQEVGELAKIFSIVLRKMEKILGVNFPFNFYIYPGKDWYLRLIPRLKVPGGFELGTGIFVNTSDPVVAAKKLAWRSARNH